jgi:DNA-binding NarL/FixJ family response regulator
MIENKKQSGTTTIILVENHDLTRVGIRVILGESREPATRLLEASSIDECKSFLEQQDAFDSIDLILLGAGLPAASDNEALAEILAAAPRIPVALLSGETDPALMREALELGASGFLPKSLPSPVFRAAVNLILAGGSYFPAQMLGAEPQSRARLSLTEDDTPHDPTRGHIISEGMGGFSRRQRQVLDLILKGKSNKEIARHLGISLGTAKNYVATILRLRNASSRAQLLSSFVVAPAAANGARARMQ